MLERGQRDMGVSRLAALARALGVTADHLLEVGDAAQPSPGP